MSGMHIGARIAAERKLRGLNQRQLADRAHVSHSLLTKVDQGCRPASPALISAVSRTLDLDRGHLTGQPFRFNGRGDHAIHDLVPPLRREILSAYLPPETDRPAPSVAELRIAVAELSAGPRPATSRPSAASCRKFWRTSGWPPTCMRAIAVSR